MQVDNIAMLTSQVPLVISNGLIAYWSFNDGIGTLARDYSGKGNDATLSGSTLPSWVSGKVGTCLSFTGTASCFVETSTPVTTAITNVSMCAWFRTNNYTQAGQMIIHNGSDNAGNGYGFALNNESTTSGQIQILYSTIAWYNTGSFVTDAGWHFGVFTINNTGIQRYYHDGSLIYTGGGGTRNTPTLHTDIGRNDYIVGHPSTARYFNGYIDEVRFYNRQISQPEITALYNAI